MISPATNHEVRPGEALSTVYEDTHGTNGNTFDDKGRLYSCESRTGRVIRTDKKGKVEVLAEKWEGKRLNAPNDIVVSKAGHVISRIQPSAIRPTTANSTFTASITSLRRAK